MTVCRHHKLALYKDAKRRLDEGQTRRQIAAHYGVTKTTVDTWLRYLLTHPS